MNLHHDVHPLVFVLDVSFYLFLFSDLHIAYSVTLNAQLVQSLEQVYNKFGTNRKSCSYKYLRVEYEFVQLFYFVLLLHA